MVIACTKWFGVAVLLCGGFAGLPALAAGEAVASIAQLRIPRLALDVPVFAGTTQKILNQGPGHVAGTALPGQAGNAAISAHRDRHFLPLKDIRAGDVVEVDTAAGTLRYQVAEIFITDALDVSVLEPTETPTITLITCHPFVYDGYAPDRFIVRAHIQID